MYTTLFSQGTIPKFLHFSDYVLWLKLADTEKTEKTVKANTHKMN